MINSFRNKNALLLGNGINLLDATQSISWGALLNDIKNHYNIEVDIDNEFKPFPLGFEEMLYVKQGDNSTSSKLKNLKQSIRNSIGAQLRNKRGFNEYHKKITEIGYDSILTTNYDYALELSMVNDFKSKKSTNYAINKQEIKFSLKRKYGGFGKDLPEIWHIHGELESSRKISDKSKNYIEESIMIGYEHYSSYLELIQENINGKKGKRVAENQSVISRIKNNIVGNFWTDLFFTHNIDVIGLGLDFSENHLWWLLNKRALLIEENNRIKNQKDRVCINNNIHYYYPNLPQNFIININDDNAFANLIQKVNMSKRTKAIGDVLKSFKVLTFPIDCDSYQDFYDKVIALKYRMLKHP